jgi:hypothetical protein
VARHEDEAIERLLTRALRSTTASGDVCPSAEDVAAYLERTLDGEELQRVELHLSSCARCAETLALLVESEPVAASAPPASVWWSWSAWRWAVPAAAVLVIGVWFASTLQKGREPASQMAQYKRVEAPKKEAADLAAPSIAESEAQSAASATEVQSRRTVVAGGAGTPTVPAESARVNQAPADLRREAAQASDRDQSLDQVARAASEADSAAARRSTPAQPSPDQPRAAKAESRADAALADAIKDGATSAVAPPAAPAAAPPAAPPTAAPPRSPAGGAARAAAGAAAPPVAQRQEAAEAAPERARTVAAFAPLVLRTRAGDVLWRITGSVVERSTDGGTTWATEFRAPATVSTGVVAADDTVWLAGARGLVLRRPAAGGWRVVSPPSMDDLVGVSEPATTAVTVRTADGRQFRTTDNGATWMAR